MLRAPFLTLSLRPIRENLSREISKDPWLYPACSLITRNTRKGKKTVSESFPFKQIILLKRDFSSFLRDINLDVYIYIRAIRRWIIYRCESMQTLMPRFVHGSSIRRIIFFHSLFSNRRECVSRQHRFFNIVFIQEPRGLGARTHPTRINGLLV